MDDNQRVETDEYTGDMTKNSFLACPNDSVHQESIVWSNFIKVVRNKEDYEGKKGDNVDYGVSSGVKIRFSGCRCLDL